MKDEKPWRKTTVGRLAVLVLLATVVVAHARVTPAQKCATAKNKAAAKKIESKLKCYQKAAQQAVGVDASCLTTAESKFSQAIAKADAAGGCVISGDAGPIEAAVDSCVNAITTLTPVAPPACPTVGDGCGTTCGGHGACAARAPDYSASVCVDGSTLVNPCNTDADCGPSQYCVASYAQGCASLCP